MDAKCSTALAPTLIVGCSQPAPRCRDPEQVFNLRLASEDRVDRSGEMSPEVAWLRSRLLPWIEGRVRLEIDARPPQLDEETRQGLSALGYLD